MKKVIIVVPVYREMNEFERISMQQLLRVLGHYDLCLIAPASMHLKSYRHYYPFEVKRFDDSYFKTTDSYSALLLSADFYREFADYEYIFIYQLDGFVFSDRLQEFCRLSYDYIGAPMPHIIWPQMLSLIGNGGISLRKIAKCIALLSHIDRKEIQRKLPLQTSAEDVIFSWCAADPQYDFTAAPYEVAQMFAVDYDTHHFYRKVKENLPFANHAWAKTDYPFWRPIIESFGYTVPPAAPRYRIPMKVHVVVQYMVQRMLRSYGEYEKKKEIMQQVFPLEGYVLWGNGIRGKRCRKLLSDYGIRVERIFDQSVTEKTVEHGHILEYPTEERIMASRGKIMITPWNNEDDIAKWLTEKGYKINKDFFKWSDVSYRIAQLYCAHIWGKNLQVLSTAG